MIVYRIEHEVTGLGPYNPGKLPDEHRARHADLDVFGRFSYGRGDTCPTPPDDGIPGSLWDFPTHLFFGFESPEALAAWFGAGFVEEAAAAGFAVGVYSAPAYEVLIGGHQVAFPRADSHLIRRCRSFAELLDDARTPTPIS